MNITHQPQSTRKDDPVSDVAMRNLVPRGLDYLTQVDQLLIHQQIEMLEVMTGFQCQNRYQIKNSLGQPVYFAAEESGGCERYFCGSQRGFVIHISDNFGTELLRVVREFKCCTGCCWCADSCEHCAYIIHVETADGELCGSVKQSKSLLSTKLVIRNTDSEDVLKVAGPACICQAVCCQGDVNFRVYTAKEMIEIGCLAKQWGGFGREAFTQASNFSLTVPLDLDVRMKAVLLGSIFLLDFIHFEQRKKNN